MACYDSLMTNFGPKKGDPHSIYYSLVIGPLAGTFAVTCTYPTDLVRKLLQLNGQPGHKYDNALHACKILYSREGAPGFFKGLIPTYIKVIPMTAVMFMTNEWLK